MGTYISWNPPFSPGLGPPPFQNGWNHWFLIGFILLKPQSAVSLYLIFTVVFLFVCLFFFAIVSLFSTIKSVTHFETELFEMKSYNLMEMQLRGIICTVNTE